ncbi:MAG: hypothetical protein A2381_12170 [Bdellovibrionales bacterium RIFOXYB1_FULL_37_110]|nr:MAG: hypothetical protein A2181_01890 [Bdellovibrionales bacterium RIFOXYA1_FULL_38_20]OFZ52251.1 MAG: hypothetical protein A2417_06010 [Bdellovibrionales bacterium RIFOXYC1_FULL_37_79]OFZ57238.1 MAG: hypothetical protein A2381_12170 [Bdellovibrionales bacterium RIFOXYB1_FULL_37_110]OFZ65240.1 MAG: hypothetical protein A2577_04605 [Bdellovibrionales bacterium RIFOXYD1_FULL_36_51]
MKNLLLGLLILGNVLSFTLQADEGNQLYLTCLVTSDGVNPNIPRKFEVYMNIEQRNWLLVYNVAGIPTDLMKQIASGDIYQQKQTNELLQASFIFEDGSTLDIDFKTGESKSNNIIFRQLERGILKECKLQ